MAGERVGELVVVRQLRVVARSAAVHGAGRRDRAEHRVELGNERRISAQARPPAHQSEELLGGQREGPEAVEQPRNLGNVPACRRLQVGAGLRPAVCGHHAEREIGDLVERRRLRRFDARTCLSQRRGARSTAAIVAGVAS